MRRLFGKAFGEHTIHISDLAVGFTTGRIIGVPQNCEEPGAHICADFKFFDVGPGFDQSILNHVIRDGTVPGQADGKGAHGGQMLHQLVAGIRIAHPFLPAFLSCSFN